MKRQYHVKPDKQDERDILFKGIFPIHKLPSKIDLRPFCPPVYDQGQEGSCTANAGVASYSMITKQPSKLFSRQFLYHMERSLEGTVKEDSGASMRDIAKALQKFGVCEESYMPYTQDNLFAPPSKDAIGNAALHKATAYHRVTSQTAIKQALADTKTVMIGIKVYSSFESAEVAKTGIVPIPKSTEEFMGGHAVLIVGYDDEKEVYIVRNSWGAEWGMQGYFLLPYKFISKGFAYDFWVLDK